jgi:hypothetical protein
VMKDSPTVYGARGPYLIFVSLDPSKAAKDPKADPKVKKTPGLADMPADEVAKGDAIVKKNLDLMEKFYDGWIENMGPIFGMTRYGPDNSDDRTLFKMNVFTKEQDYQIYNAKMGTGLGGFARAFYSPMEPRFIVTYDGGADEDAATTTHVQCHEATHQLVHFYTWDLSRQALKRDVTWLDCYVRPTWSTEGFAEFFSSYEMKDGKFAWMQPLESRLKDVWLLSDIIQSKKWLPWELKEFLSFRVSNQMQEAAAVRANKTPQERGLAESIMGNLYYAKAWSLVYFMWYADENGKPKYRDRYIEYLKREFHLVYAVDPAKKAAGEQSLPVGVNDFRKIMKIDNDPALAAFEKEWQAFEAKLVAAHKNPKWEAERANARKALHLDK